MSLTLAINTASSKTSIALIENSTTLLSESNWQSENNEAEKLMPEIHELLTKNAQDFKDLSDILVISGPGSFTGLRIGVTVANTISYLTGAKLFAQNSFEYHWATQEEGTLLIYAGSRGLYLSKSPKDYELINLDDIPKDIEKPFGDISEEQKSHLNTEFTESDLSFGQVCIKLLEKELKPVQIVKPNYVKPPGITNPKK